MNEHENTAADGALAQIAPARLVEIDRALGALAARLLVHVGPGVGGERASPDAIRVFAAVDHSGRARRCVDVDTRAAARLRLLLDEVVCEIACALPRRFEGASHER